MGKKRYNIRIQQAFPTYFKGDRIAHDNEHRKVQQELLFNPLIIDSDEDVHLKALPIETVVYT